MIREKAEPGVEGGLSLSEDGPRRALCLGVNIAAEAAAGDSADEPELAEFEPLPFVVAATQELAVELEYRDFAVSCVVDPAELSADKLGTRVTNFLRSFTPGSDQVALVHILGHGKVEQSDELYALGSDGRTDPETEVSWWRRAVTVHGPLTLFLVDLCHAGASMRGWRPARPEYDETEKAWVIAATGADEPAYAGRFTRAVTEVLRGLREGHYDLDESVAWVPFWELHRLIKRAVLDLADASDGLRQYVVCTATMGSPPELPFVPNPRYRPPSPAVALAAELEPATAEFLDPLLDPVMDARHFESRASGHGRAPGELTGGAFRGRAPQLAELSRWFDAPGDFARRGQPGLMLVRGSPGSGKSALLGVCVCAAHPRLRAATVALWQVAAECPSLQHRLAAVHARQHDLTEITASLGRQLLGGDGGVYPGENLYPGPDLYPSGPRSPEELVAALRELPDPPIVILDALDEALDPAPLINRLLLPLAQTVRDDGRQVCLCWSEPGPGPPSAGCSTTPRTTARSSTSTQSR